MPTVDMTRALMIGGPLDGEALDVDPQVWVVFCREPRRFCVSEKHKDTTSPSFKPDTTYRYVEIVYNEPSTMRIFKFENMPNDEIFARLLIAYAAFKKYRKEHP